MSVLAAIDRRKGWCPGALRPMPSGDGLLVRVRPAGGVLAPGQLQGLADLAERGGNGLVDLTRRANLQLRGVRPDTLETVQHGLAALDLLDEDADREALRNVVRSPALVHGETPLAAARLADALEAALLRDPAFRCLPAKFAFVVDDGGPLPLDDIAADLRLVFEGEGVRIVLDGETALAACVPPGGALDTALALTRTFIKWSGGDRRRRMRDLVSEGGARAVFASAGVRSEPLHGPRRTPVDRRRLIGPRPGGFGVAAAFGRLTSEQMREMAGLPPAAILLTPWQVAILTGLGDDVRSRLAGIGLIVDPGDPRLAVAACPGAPSCGSAETSTREVATALAPLARGLAGDDIALHVSGCAKGCARSLSTRFVLVGRNGRFDLVLDGRADAAPIRTGLSPAELDEALRQTVPAEDR